MLLISLVNIMNLLDIAHITATRQHEQTFSLTGFSLLLLRSDLTRCFKAFCLFRYPKGL